MKDMMTSKDWMPKYAGEHEDIDYKDMLRSDFADGEKSASEASVAAAKKTDGSEPSDYMSEYFKKIGVAAGNGASPSPRMNLPSYKIPLTRASSRQSSLASGGGKLSALPSFDLLPLTRSRSRQSSVTSPGGKLLSGPSSDFKMSVDIGSFDALTSRPLTRSSSRQSSLASRSKLPTSGASNDNFKMSVDLTSLGLTMDPLIMSRSVDTVGSNNNTAMMSTNESSAAQQILALKELHRKEATEESARKKTTTKEKRKRPPRRPKEPLTKEYVEPRENDVLLGRGGRSNHHVGNKYYRAKTEEMRDEYRAAKKEDKTEISQRLVDWVLNEQKANFLNLDTSTDKWYIIHDNTQRRRKASQALREHMTLEEREQRKKGGARR